MAQPARFPPFRDPSVTSGSEGVCQVENLTSFRTPDLHFPPSVAPLRKVSEMTPKRVSEYFPKCVSDFAEIRSGIANNQRFLILPFVNVRHLASHVLGRVARRIAADWQVKYGHRPVLLETFVERERFAGTCYRAANWQGLGSTQGRSRQDRRRTLQVPVKEIYVYPLRADAREALKQ